MQLKIHEKPSGREWTITCNEEEIMHMFAMSFKWCAERVNLGSQERLLLTKLFVLCPPSQQERLLDIFKILSPCGEFTSLVGRERIRLGGSINPEDRKKLDPYEKEGGE